ncbi:reverse transcriptase domain-containing protein [Tanacetum coccineum]
MYLAASGEAVSAVPMADSRGKQTPIRYVSRTLHEAGKKTTPHWKSWHYILNKPEASGKLAKYAVELWAYNIAYIPRNAVKGQVLADFLNEVPVGTGHIEVCSLTDDTKLEEWTLFTDGASSLKGAGAGLVLIDLSRTEYTYAIRLNFASTNNKAEYEALLAGLRIAGKMKVPALKVKAKELLAGFKKFSIENVPRNQNQKADVLSKLASVAFNHLTKEILVEVLNAKSVEAREMNAIVEEEEDNWMTPIIKCIEEGIWPENENEARALRMKIGQYVMEEGIMFKKSYMSLMLRCIGPLQANYIIREVHEGACGMHAGARSVVAKIMRQGYYWPSMHQDIKEVVDRCDSCQIHGPVPRLPKTKLTSIMSPWSFYQWGLDILGPLPEGPGKLKYIIVAIDYFTKWMFGLPRVIVTDNGTQLVNDPFKGWCEKWKIKQINTAVAHPQANGLVERANKSNARPQSTTG